MPQVAHRMLESHPRQPWTESSRLAETIAELYSCAQSCTACADACLGEEGVGQMVRCIRICQDCADICETTGRILSRQTEPDSRLLSAQLQACIAACRVCATVCGRHAEHMDHCAVCAAQCRACEAACEDMVTALAA